MSDENSAAADSGGSMSLDEAAAALLAPVEDKPKRQPAEDEAPPATPETDEADDAEGDPEEDTAKAKPAEADDEADPEDEPDDAADDDADEDDGDEDEHSATVQDDAKVTLDDGTETTVAELKRGHLRQSDYTRKTQELGEQRKAARQQLEKLEEWSKTLLPTFQLAQQTLKALQPQPPDQQLRYSDPVEYAAAFADYQQAMTDWNHRIAEVDRGLDTTNAARDANRKAASADQIDQRDAALMKAIPELNDHRKEPTLKAIRETAEELGFKLEELKTTPDARLVYALHLAAKARNLEQAAPKVKKKTEGKPPVQKPGKRQTSAERRQRSYEEGHKRLAATGSVDDAADLIKAAGIF